MSHLSPSEFVDLADGALPPDRASHVDACAACRSQAETVLNALRLADAGAPVPEPSPLFWDHLSARVREAIADAPRRSGFGVRGLRPIAAALALGVFLLSAVLLTRAPRQEPVSTNTQTSAPAAGDAVHTPDPALAPEHAAEWAVLTAAAADLGLDEARDAGMAVPSASVDLAVAQLTRAELSELGRLLESELKGSSN